MFQHRDLCPLGSRTCKTVEDEGEASLFTDVGR